MARVGSLGGGVLEYRGVLRHFPHFRRNALLALAGTKEAGGGGEVPCLTGCTSRGVK